MLRTVTATRYVMPLREGGSLPGLVECDDLGLPVPELVLVDVDPVLGRAEPDEEARDLLRASAGLNLGTGYLPGSLGCVAAHV